MVVRRRHVATGEDHRAQQIRLDMCGSGVRRPDLIEDSHRNLLIIRVIQGPDSHPSGILGPIRGLPRIVDQVHGCTVAIPGYQRHQ